jgi:urea transport system permease protein
VTLLAPKGLGGLFDLIPRRADRQGDWGPDDGAWRKEEGTP